MTRSTGRWRTRFGTWIGSTTVRGITAQLHDRGFPLTQKAVYNWLAGIALPALPVADALVRISKGHITVSDIVQHRDTVNGSGGNGADGSSKG